MTFLDVLSGLNVDVYFSYISQPHIPIRRQYCNCKLIEIYFCLLAPETGTGNTLTH